MSRLPTVGSDDGSWGTVLNDYLSISHTSEGRLKDFYFNIKTYGALGDGSTDDASSIQTAIDAAQVNGGVVYIPRGTYVLSTSLLVRNSTTAITLKGEGRAVSILKLGSAVNDYALKFSMVNTSSVTAAVFEDFAIDGNNSVQSAGGCIYAQGAVQCQFTRLHLHHAYNNALYLYQDGNGGTGHHNRVTNCLFDNSAGSSGDGRAILIEASDENFITGCDFETNGRAAATEPNHIFDRSGLNIVCQNTFVGGATGVKCENSHSVISGNIFDGTNDHCVRLNGDDHVVTNNQFYNIGNDAGGSPYDGVWIDNVSRTLVTGNNFQASTSGTRSGVNIANSSSSTLVEGNVFGSAGTFGSGKVIVTGSGHVIRNNIGYITEAGGSATVLNGTTSIAVTHGLSYTPVAGDISVTPTNNMGSASEYWVDTLGSSTFTINVNADPTGAGASFAWRAGRV